jgi:hypothetical protein
MKQPDIAELKAGDFVLATKYSDGDPKDQWSVGIYSYSENGRLFVVDDNRQSLRCNGFRRAKKISQERGRFLLEFKEHIEKFDRSLWWWVRCSMKKAGLNLQAKVEKNE